MLELEEIVCFFLHIISGMTKHLDIFLGNYTAQNENLLHTLLAKFELMLLKAVFWTPRLSK